MDKRVRSIYELIPLQTVRYRTRSDGIDYTVVCLMTHDCSRKLWKQHQCKLSVGLI